MSLAMESRGGKQVITFLYVQEETRDSCEGEKNINRVTNDQSEKHERDAMENEKKKPVKRERIVFPAQYSGQISCEKATKILRKAWPESVVRMLTVRKTGNKFEERCGLEHLEVEAFVESGFDFDNYFARPANDCNWPHRFVPAYICNCKLNETCV